MEFILIAFVVLTIIYYLIIHGRTYYFLHKIPGPTTLPIIGNYHNFFVPPNKFWNTLRRMSNNYYPTWRMWLGKMPIVNIIHPDDYEIILSSPKYITKGALYELMHAWFGTGLLTSTGSKWRHRRKILTPAFHFNVLRQFVNIFDGEGQRMVRDLLNDEKKHECDVLPLVTKYTLNAICVGVDMNYKISNLETAMGTSLENIVTVENKYRKAVHDMAHYLLYRLQRPWVSYDWVYNLSSIGRKEKEALRVIHGFSSKIIAERQQYHEDTGKIYLNNNNEDTTEIQSSSKRRMAMLDLLIAAMKNGHIDDDGIREEVDTFIFEGHDTTGMAMCFALLLLAEHTEIQQRAREEIDKILNESGGKMEMTEIQQFTYLERCLKESLRLYPSVPLISRQINEDMQLTKFVVPRGTVVQLHIFDTHHDANFWPDPEHFDPDRFLPERLMGRHPFSYVPFSAGQRNCIGQKFAMLELKALIAHLLRNFYLEPIDLASNTEILPDLVLRPSHPIRVNFVPR